MSDPKNTVLVTGAAMGIGKAVAENLVAAGKSVVLMDVNGDALAETVRALGPRAVASVGSVANAADSETAVALAVERFGGLGGLSHNAGIQRYGDVVTTSRELWDEVMSVNLTGAFLVAKAAMPQLRQHKGAVVLTASIQGMAAQKGALAYVVAKHGLIGLVTGMAMDEAENGVRVNGVAPGSVDTPMLRWAIGLDPDPASLDAVIDGMHPLGRRGKPEEIASVIAFLLSDQASFMTGETVRVDGGVLARIAGAPKPEDRVRK
ncbi:SDR family NAD(P)-dependent oxidoreductase [Paradevosia shaoguanensis]|uniref:SDR family NAD(P)-dependent oxidoreductase n=1 Tax=Paradevosia shaoguanensis TaxID=1335043 RepID=UPI001932E6F1|nr:SDR family oxidoreductase [Paradevosia shaoguanensis]